MTTDMNGAGAIDVPWDPATWEPTEVVEPVVMTEAEREQWRLEWLVGQAESFGLAEVPDVPLVRWAQSNRDASDAIAGCLTESGFAATAIPTGGISWQVDLVPQAQQGAYDLAVYSCFAQYTLDPRMFQEWTPEQVGLIYDYWVTYFEPCMAAQGYPGGGAQPPSREVWVSTFGTSERPQWHPPETLEAITDLDAQSRVAQVCPAYPPDEVFYGL